MPSEDYTAVTPGGLKLKGVKGSRISKSHRKRQKPNPETSSKDPKNDGADSDGATANHDSSTSIAENQTATTKAEEQDSEKDTNNEPSGKTEAELRHEERRRRRLDERLKREGTKTHKERVEELNRYLSNLSEHHDMPRIGPG